MHVSTVAPHTVDIRWESEDVDISRVEHFYIEVVDRDCTKAYVLVEAGRDARYIRLHDVPHGRFGIIVREQNDQGVGGGCCMEFRLITWPVPPSPTPTDTLEPTLSPTPSLTGEPTVTPSP
jgi:hypothetical protein